MAETRVKGRLGDGPGPAGPTAPAPSLTGVTQTATGRGDPGRNAEGYWLAVVGAAPGRCGCGPASHVCGRGPGGVRERRPDAAWPGEKCGHLREQCLPCVPGTQAHHLRSKSSLAPLDKGTMATLTQVTLTCDVCGKAKDVQTRTIGLDGKSYEIDLCPKDGKGLSKAAGDYVSNARKVAARQAPRENGRRPRSRTETAAVRDWARTSGMQISDRGRVPAAVFRDYEAAH